MGALLACCVSRAMKGVFAILFLLPPTLLAEDLSGFSKVLFPVLTSRVVTGLHNTRFSTSLQISASRPAAVYPSKAPDDEIPTIAVINPGLSRPNLFDPVPSAAGRMLFFKSEAPSDVGFIYELLSERPEMPSHSTTLPAVRESQFRRGITYLPEIATSPIYEPATFPPRFLGHATRNTVRVYDVDNTGMLEVTVRLTHPALPDFAFPLRVDQRDGFDDSFPMYAVLNLTDLCITLPTGNRCRPYTFGVEVVPNRSDLRYFAFSSTTINETGQTSVHFAQ